MTDNLDLVDWQRVAPHGAPFTQWGADAVNCYKTQANCATCPINHTFGLNRFNEYPVQCSMPAAVAKLLVTQGDPDSRLASLPDFEKNLLSFFYKNSGPHFASKAYGGFLRKGKNESDSYKLALSRLVNKGILMVVPGRGANRYQLITNKGIT